MVTIQVNLHLLSDVKMLVFKHRWLLNTGDCLIKLAFKTGLTNWKTVMLRLNRIYTDCLAISNLQNKKHVKQLLYIVLRRTGLSKQCRPWSVAVRRAFRRAFKTEKLKAPLFPGPYGAGTTNYWCITGDFSYGKRVSILLNPFYL